MQTSNWIALGALVISAVALWRTEWGRASDRRTSVRKEEAALRLALDELLKKIRLGLQSRQRITAMTGQAGNLATFTGEVAADTQELERLRARLALATSSAAQDAAVTIHEVRARAEQLGAKYAAAWAEDEVQRQRRYDEMIARVNRSARNPDTSPR